MARGIPRKPDTYNRETDEIARGALSGTFFAARN